MYIPSHFEEVRIEEMHELMRQNSLATLVTLTSSGLSANHIPLHLGVGAPPYGVLRGHVARANPIWSDLNPDVDVLAIFHGPQAYISPNWYPSKLETGKAVPTWNYATVHAYGRLRVIDDKLWLRTQLEAMTAHHEASFSEPWQVSDAPADYLEKMLEAVVGIELVITRLSGKWKTSQNQPASNQAGVVHGLQDMGTPEAVQMAKLVAKNGKA